MRLLFFMTSVLPNTMRLCDLNLQQLLIRLPQK